MKTIDIFEHDELVVNVLTQMAEKVDFNCVELVLLDCHFSAKEGRKFMNYLIKKQVTKQKLSKKKAAKKLLKIKPDIVNAKDCVDQFKAAFIAEGRFPDILNQ